MLAPFIFTNNPKDSAFSSPATPSNIHFIYPSFNLILSSSSIILGLYFLKVFILFLLVTTFSILKLLFNISIFPL